MILSSGKLFFLFVLVILAVRESAQAQSVGQVPLEISGVWVSERYIKDELNGTTWTEKTILEIAMYEREVKITPLMDTSGTFTNPVVLRLDGLGEKNVTFTKNGASREIASISRIENGILVREIDSRSTWEPSEFPAKIIEQYQLKKKGRRLVLTTILQGNHNPIPTSVWKPVTLRMEFERKAD